MTYITGDLSPKQVFKNFEDISRIPRSSGNEKELSDYIYNFAKKLNLEAHQDDYNNIIVKKPATNGKENPTTVMLQAHMDMVAEAGDFSNHDFEKDPISLIIDGNHLRADNTTLGADNGIGVAYMLSILEDQDIKHPNLECVFTTDEEMGLLGVNNMDLSEMKSSYVINLDSEEDYNILVGCAGAVNSKIKLRKEYKPVNPTNIALEINVVGLFGGHSGMDIDKNRGNANVIMGRVLNSISSNYDLFTISGGSKRNAIPRNCETVISLSSDVLEKTVREIQKTAAKIQKEFYSVEPRLKISLRRAASIDFKVFTDECKNKIINALLVIPHGVVSMEDSIKDMVQTSTNFAVVSETDNHIEFTSLTRSSLQSKKDFIKSKLTSIASLLGAKIEFSAEYPAWEYKNVSKLEDLAVKTYEEMFEKSPNVVIMHCGLECGILLNKLEKNAEAISIGPTMDNVHTPEEYVEIDSVEKIWEYLKKLLENL